MGSMIATSGICHHCQASISMSSCRTAFNDAMMAMGKSLSNNAMSDWSISLQS